MDSLVRLTALLVLSLAAATAVPAAADYDGPDGYGTTITNELDVSYDGYVREGQSSGTYDPTTYVVIEAENGTTEQVDGETVIVVQEPEPVAATKQAPPPPQTVVVEQPVVRCPGAIWVDGYWAYSDGDYVWVEGHCVVERVNYVFVQPRWDYYASVWWFVPGYYRPWGVYVGFGYYRPWHWYPPYHHAYYRRGHPVPVHRSVPRHPTTVRTTPAPRAPSRGVLTRPIPTRTDTVARTPSRTPSVTRAPTTRTVPVSRTRPSTSRVDTVSRAHPTATRTTVVDRPPRTYGRTSTVGRTGGTPSRTGTVGRTPTITRAPTVTRTPTTRPPARSPPGESRRHRGPHRHQPHPHGQCPPAVFHSVFQSPEHRPESHQRRPAPGCQPIARRQLGPLERRPPKLRPSQFRGIAPRASDGAAASVGRLPGVLGGPAACPPPAAVNPSSTLCSVGRPM